MNNMYKTHLFRFVFIFALFFIGVVSHAAMLTNAGFTSDEIIVSNSTPESGLTVKLSIPIYNESDGVLSGIVRLYVDDKKISEKSFILKPGEFDGATFPWIAIKGNHDFLFKFEETMIQYPKKPKEIVVLYNREAKISIFTQFKVGEEDKIVSKEDAILKEYEVVGTIDTKTNTESIGIDSYRKDFLYDIEQKVGIIKKDISESVKSNQEYEERLIDLRKSVPGSDGQLLTPLQYLYAWILGAVAYILSNMYIFYGLIALILFILIRFIAHKVRHSHVRTGR
ncbi:hypothetical protein A3C57_02735 [Candidatus Nomurabacteria bacterium RIFCSPHIGHO2_02_FULL_33_12]|uniref:Uncharacterized protein n=1 Tax=Candidatus Nomurabacteria bacterium RIFCSPLOWO2_01_FULL_33_17 TaxID=1801764 RepID=A0A1F6WP12_9BACT|nr:MAG: hypothetical protein A3C57_02735 [Candidatus Nomurabacteria bacterium RIFCSPHIGHO2_02_FULL_33_12]OGI83566.1 MAG: hypothetical protein A2903_02505 [Candidatus Nomurabacteria bacterium RIFCSPLOWO2_01_FULL_33_17]